MAVAPVSKLKSCADLQWIPDLALSRDPPCDSSLLLLTLAKVPPVGLKRQAVDRRCVHATAG